MLIKAGTYRFNDTLVNTQEMLDTDTWELFIDMEFDDLHGNSYQQLYYMAPSYIGMAKSKDQEEFVKLPDDRTIIIKNDVNKGSLVCDWFTTNTTEVKTTATIKAGTYRLNDVLSAVPDLIFNTQVEITFNSNSKDYASLVIGGATASNFGIGYAVDVESGDVDLSYVSEGLADLDDDYIAGWQDEAYKTITIPNDTEVSAEFYEWFTANAVEQKEISGKWRFREVLTPPADAFKETVSFLNGGDSFNAMYAKTIAGTTGFGLEYSNITASGGEIVSVYADGEYGDLFAVSGWVDSGYRTVDFGTEPRTVSAEFYNWLTANATPPTASITYNGSTITSLFGGQTATLKCAGMKMTDDVVVEVKEQTGGGGSGVAINLANLPEVDNLEVTETSPTAVRYDGEIYLLVEE